MTYALDTSVLVRILVGSPQPLASQVVCEIERRRRSGDVGRVNSDASGTRAASRAYWSNKNTAIMSDLPTEVLSEPDLWGTFRFE